MLKLTETEQAAIDALKSNGGSMLLNAIPDKAERDVFGCPVAGRATYKKLEKMGLVFLTDESSEDGFDWTPSYYLVEGLGCGGGE
jgi:hypothetical protein